MKHKYRFLAVLLALLLILPHIPFAQASQEDDLRQTIIQSCIDETPVSIIDYQITVSELDLIFKELYHGGKLPWYTRNEYSYYYYEGDPYVHDFYPVSLDETEYDRVLYELRVAEIIDAIIFEDMSQWQMALAVHDYLAANSIYDESYSFYSSYDLLIRGTAVCEGYARAYMDIMNRLGIPCIMVVSEEMDHGWNMVNLYGSWYHVDVTWDDPTPDSYGTVMHNYFLVTDRQMREDCAQREAEGLEGHRNWDAPYTSTDESYVDAFWVGIESQICYLDGSTSFLRQDAEWETTICSRDEYTGELTVLYSFSTKGLDIGEGMYLYPSTGLSLWNGRLYFARPNGVRSINLEGRDLSTHYLHDTENEHTYVRGVFVSGDTVYMTLSTHNYDDFPARVDLKPTGYHVHDYMVWETEGTCKDPGSRFYCCSCGINLETETETTDEHSYSLSSSHEPTMFETGWLRYTCSVCGDTYAETIPCVTFGQWLSGLFG